MGAERLPAQRHAWVDEGSPMTIVALTSPWFLAIAPRSMIARDLSEYPKIRMALQFANLFRR